MRGSKLYVLVMAGAVFVAPGCTSDAASARAFDAGPDARPHDGGMNPSGDVSVPGVQHRRDGGETDAAPPRPSGAPDATRDAAPHVEDASSADARPVNTDADAESIPDADRPPTGYPKGPYGTQIGDTLPYLQWEGYVEGEADAGLVSDGPWTPYSTDALRRSGKRLALVHLADFDCPGCNHAATILAARAPAAEREGAAIVEVLGSRYIQAAPADRAHLDAWITTYDLRVTSVIDAPGHELSTLKSFGIRETALVVDLATMQIVYRVTGNLAPNGPTSLDGAFDYIHDAKRD